MSTFQDNVFTLGRSTVQFDPDRHHRFGLDWGLAVRFKPWSFFFLLLKSKSSDQTTEKVLGFLRLRATGEACQQLLFFPVLLSNDNNNIIITDLISFKIQTKCWILNATKQCFSWEQFVHLYRVQPWRLSSRLLGRPQDGWSALACEGAAKPSP